MWRCGWGMGPKQLEPGGNGGRFKYLTAMHLKPKATTVKNTYSSQLTHGSWGFVKGRDIDCHGDYMHVVTPFDKIIN